MLSTDVSQAIELQKSQEPRESWGDIALSISFDIAGLVHRRRGDLADLRRMDPEHVDAAVFWRILARHDMPNLTEDWERKWALIVHGIALMTPTNVPENSRKTAHKADTPVGRALYLGPDSRRDAGFYSESRLNRLLTARGQMQQVLLARLFRMLAKQDCAFNWREMAWFILNEGHSEDAAERARMQIAREYYRAERRNAPADAIDQ